MKRFKSAILLCWLCVATSFAYEKTPDGIKTTVGQENISITFITPKTVRVVKSPAGETEKMKTSYSVVATPENVDFKVTEKGGATVVSSNALSVAVSKSDGSLSFSKAGKRLLSENGSGSF